MILIILFFLSNTLYSSETTVKFDISTSDFGNLVTTDHFFDKTDFIKVFFHSTPMVMICAPRRFGKSANMDMIKRFAEITVDRNGNRINRELTNNFELFSGYNLKVFKNKSFFSKHFGKYPVIFINFKKLSIDNYKSFIDSFRIFIRETFVSHCYLLKSINFMEHDVDDFEQYYNLKLITQLSDIHLRNSIYTLSRLLYSHFNKSGCILLIDEYDAPIKEAIFRSGTDINRIINFIQKFISTSLKSNPYISNGLINSCIRFGGNLSPDANNIKHVPFLKNIEFSPFLGFTEKEIKSFLRKRKWSEMLAQIKDMYDGYRTEMSNVIIYNPLSIASCLHYKKLEGYWVDSGAKQYIKKLFLRREIQEKIFRIITDNTRKDIRLLNNLEVEHILKLKDIVNDKIEVKMKEEDVDLFLEYMLDSGYFVIEKRLTANKAMIRVPNQEIREFIEENLYTIPFFNDILKIGEGSIVLFLESIRKLNDKENSFKEFATSVVRLFNHTQIPASEAELERCVAAILRYFGGFVEVKNQLRTTRNKKIDIVIVRQDLTGIIIELKYKTETSKAALQQIVKRNHYYEVFDKELKHLNVHNRIYIGLYLGGHKNCKLSYLYNSLDIKNSKNIAIK